jgi:hypothetical protein
VGDSQNTPKPMADPMRGERNVCSPIPIASIEGSCLGQNALVGFVRAAQSIVAAGGQRQ